MLNLQPLSQSTSKYNAIAAYLRIQLSGKCFVLISRVVSQCARVSGVHLEHEPVVDIRYRPCCITNIIHSIRCHNCAYVRVFTTLVYFLMQSVHFHLLVVELNKIK